MMITTAIKAIIESKKMPALCAFRWATLLIQSCFIFYLHIDGFRSLDVDAYD